MTEKNIIKKYKTQGKKIRDIIQPYNIEDAIKLKNNKAPGSDGVLTEMVKEGN